MAPRLSTRPPPPPEEDGAPDSDAMVDSHDAARDAVAALSAEQRRRVTMALPMMERCCAWFVRHYPGLFSQEELLAPATIALCEAARTYRPEEHVSFGHYAKNNVQGRLFRFVKKECGTLRVKVERAMRRAQHDVSGRLRLPVDTCTDDEETLRDAMRDGAAQVAAAMFLAALQETRGATPEEQLIALEGEVKRREAVTRAIVALPPELREVIVLVYVHDQSFVDIAAAVGIHANTASNRHARAIRLLHKVLADLDEDDP
jgi:RNA polymerase sigma factor (sigma-70 family)